MILALKKEIKMSHEDIRLSPLAIKVIEAALERKTLPREKQKSTEDMLLDKGVVWIAGEVFSVLRQLQNLEILSYDHNEIFYQPTPLADFYYDRGY